MKYLFTFLLLIISSVTFAQHSYIPYRVGNKFGLIDEQQKIVVKPQFDGLEYAPLFEFLNAQPNYFQGFNFVNNEVLSSFIVDDKVIIKDNKANHFYKYHDLIVAATILGEKELESLYSINGKALLQDQQTIKLYKEFDKENQMKDVLIWHKDLNDKFSLKLYNKAQAKFTKTFINKGELIELDNDFASYNKSVWFIIKKEGSNDIGIKYTLKFDDNSINLVKTEEVTIKEEYRYGRDDYNSVPNIEPDRNRNKVKKVIDATQLYVFGEITHKVDTPKKIATIDVNRLTNNSKYKLIDGENGQKGLKDLFNGKLIIPTIYDEIYVMRTDEWTIQQAFIVKSDSKFGCIYFINGEMKIINPQFDYIPIISKLNIGKDQKVLIKLFDTEYNFFCFGDDKGIVYYQS